MRYAVPALAILLFFSSCSDSPKSTRTYKITEEALLQLAFKMNQHTTIEYKSLEYKVADPSTHYQAVFWQPKAAQIKTLTSEMIDYIETLRNDLKKEAGLKTNGDKEEYNENNVNAVTLLFEKRNKGHELFNKLEEYKKDMLGIDEKMKNVFQNYIVLTTKSFDRSSQSGENFVLYFFKGNTVDVALCILGVFESNIRTMENDLVTYCKAQIGSVDGFSYTKFSPLVGQSSNFVKAGDKIILTAGVGAFSVRSSPKITIDRKDINLYPDGVAIYEFKTPVKAGKYLKAVKIEYTELDGTKQTKTFNIDYTVIEPK